MTLPPALTQTIRRLSTSLSLVLCLLSLVLVVPSALGADDETDHNQARAHVIEGHGGVPLVVQEWGNPEGSPIVLLHGFSFGAVSFKHQIGDIARRHRIIAPDLRGHGLSAKPWVPEAYNDSGIWAQDLQAVLSALNIEQPLIVGWSFGGYVGVHYLRHCGAECASGLVLVGSLAGLVPRPPPPDPADSNMPPPTGDARADNYHDFFLAADWLSRIMSHAPPSAQEKRQKQLTITMMAPMIRRAMVGMPLDNQDLAEDLDLPVLFIYGDKDGSIPSSSVLQAVGLLPNASVIEYKGVGHSSFAETPDQFNADLMKFADSVNSSP